MIRGIHISDLHLNLSLYGTTDSEEKMNTRSVEAFALLDSVIDVAIKKADVLFISGDIYENQSPSNRIRMEFEKRLVYCNNIGIPVVYIPGNHDIPKSEGSSHPFISDRVHSLPNVYFIDTVDEIVKVVAKNGEIIEILGLPHMYPKDWKQYGENSGEAVSNIIKKANLSGENSAGIIGHLSLAGVANNYKGNGIFSDEFVVPREVFQSAEKFSFVLLGHIHQHEWIDDKTWYSGSLFPNTFGEEKDKKGYVYFEVEKGKGIIDREFVEFENYTRFKTVYVIIDKNDKDPTNTILKSISMADLNNCIALVIYETTDEQVLNINSAKLRESLKNTKYFELCYKIIKVEDDKQKSDVSVDLKPSVAVEKFCEFKGGDFFDNSKDLIELTTSFIEEIKIEKELKLKNLD